MSDINLINEPGVQGEYNRKNINSQNLSQSKKENSVEPMRGVKQDHR